MPASRRVDERPSACCLACSSFSSAPYLTTSPVAPSFALVSFQVTPSCAARRSAVRVAPKKPLDSTAPMTTLVAMDEDSKAMAYAALAALWAASWWAMADPGDPWWATALAALAVALLAFLPAVLAASLAWNAALGLIDGFRAGSPAPRRPTLPDRLSSIRRSPPE